MSNKLCGKVVRLGCLGCGVIQMAILCGCGQGAKTGSGAVVAPDSAIEEREDGDGAGRAYVMPVRVGREFFEGRLSGGIGVAGAEAPQQAPVSWAEGAPTQAAPAPSAATGEVLADFRDHEGCATFEGRGAPGVDLCFNIMGDVSNIGLNEREMKVSGLGEYLSDKLGSRCGGDQWTFRLAKADRGGSAQGTPGAFTVSYEATPTGGCAPGPVQVDLTVSRLTAEAS